MMPKAGLIYAIEEGGLMSFITGASEQSLRATPLSPGTAMIVVDEVELIGADVRAVLATHLGRPIPPRHLAIVDNATGDVVGVVIGYRSTFAPPLGCGLLARDDAEVGDKVIDGDLIKAPQPEYEVHSDHGIGAEPR